MTHPIREILECRTVEASAPCRIDMGGTLDISTFYYPLRHLNPCTFNIALALRTSVRLLPHDPGKVKISSKGFESAEFPIDSVPFHHPLGLMFAVAAYYRADGVHIEIESASPPRSALGGSSVAAVALIGAFSAVFDKIGIYRHLYRRETAILAHALEESVAGVPCGLQDQLAAAYGGVNAWHWYGRVREATFEKNEVIKKSGYEDLQNRILVAYCGIPHESKNINGEWVRQFITAERRDRWTDVIRATRQFIQALEDGDYGAAAEAMNRETVIRMEMTPEVLDDLGRELSREAVRLNCGARFTGAGGGGCLWAVGEKGDIDSLREVWEKRLMKREGACLLDSAIDADGLTLPML